MTVDKPSRCPAFLPTSASPSRRLNAGWTEEQLTELSVHVTLNLFTNYFNHFVQTDLDVPAAPQI